MTRQLLLLQAGMAGRCISVLTETGRMPGYLLGFDDQSLILYAQFSTGDNTGLWAITHVPANQVFFIEDLSIQDVGGDLADSYLKILGGWAVMDHCALEVARLMSEKHEEEQS
jgi:hypothetical protein